MALMCPATTLDHVQRRAVLFNEALDVLTS
jgi:hypothetical protein